MSFYSDAAATAAKLIKDFGHSATLTESTKTSDPIAGTVSESVGTTHTINILEVDYSQAFGGSQDNARDDAIYLLADNAYPLKLGQKLVFGGATHFIKKLKPLRPGGEILLYGVEVVA